MVLATINPYEAEAYKLPNQVRSMFRVVCLLEPDVEQIIRAKCAQYGIKCGHILASRIKLLCEVCQGTFTTFETKSQLKFSSFIDILRSMYEKQRSSNDSRPQTSVSSGNQMTNKYLPTKAESKKKNFKIKSLVNLLPILLICSVSKSNTSIKRTFKKESISTFKLC